ncbi:P-loop NTPase [Candidatus Sumerlaeota bacterium]|nr:P-loop NTPase [Candidatus Sumerlaeota bacterium]
MEQLYSIRQVCEKTGLEESDIRFYETAFKEFLSFTELAHGKREFTSDHIALLQRIKELINKRGFSVIEVKKHLRSLTHHTNDTMEKGFVMPAKAGEFARVIAVTSGKGGVGKTNLTVSLAMLLAKRQRKVAIFDADLGLSNVHILAGVKPRYNLSHVVEDGFDFEDAIVEGPLGVKIISGGQGLREMANLTDDQRRFILRQMDKLEREVDVLLVDTGAGISDNVLRFAAFADEVICVATPNIASASDAFSIIKILLQMDPNAKIGLLANMAPSMYHAKNVYNRINTATENCMHYTLGYLGYVMEDEHIQVANQHRKPFALAFPNCEATKNLELVVDTILNKRIFQNDKKDSAFGDLIGAIKRSMAGAA